MLLTVLYFGVFLGVLVGRAFCGPARKKAFALNETEDEYNELYRELLAETQKRNERERRDPERHDVTDEEEAVPIEELQEQVEDKKRKVVKARLELWNAQASEAQVREGVQRSLAFVPMLCVLMIAVRMRAMQIHIRDPQPWAQITMYVATAAVTTQVLASILYACLTDGSHQPDEDDLTNDLCKAESSLSGGDVGLFGKVAAVILLMVRYVAATALYATMIALVFALTSMQHDTSIMPY
jgi:hypothetical protein